MQYDRAQSLLEQYVQDNWTDTALQFDNVPFNSDLYREYVRCSVVFGESVQRTVTAGSYRQIGLLVLSVFTKPGEGSARSLELANALSLLLTSKVVRSIDTPILAINLKAPDVFRDLIGKTGWVMVQLSIPFYYDLEL